MDPAEVFSRQADKCCCCSKPLTDVVSRTRGIGPECIRMFGSFTEFAEPPMTAEQSLALTTHKVKDAPAAEGWEESFELFVSLVMPSLRALAVGHPPPAVAG